MSDNTSEHEEMAFCDKYLWDAEGWDRQTADQIPFEYHEPEKMERRKRIDRWFEFLDR